MSSANKRDVVINDRTEHDIINRDNARETGVWRKPRIIKDNRFPGGEASQHDLGREGVTILWPASTEEPVPEEDEESESRHTEQAPSP